MLQRRRRKNKSSTHPSTTFINNLLHSKSTYFYNGWGRIVPTFCILALLVGLYTLLNPVTNRGAHQAYANDGIMDDDWYDSCSSRPLPADSGRSSNDSNISLTITPETIDSVDAKVGETAYSNHTVCINGSSIKSYSMSISYDDGSTSLSHSENSSISIGNVDNSGVVGDHLVTNTWGWGWSDLISTDSNTMTYKPMLAGNGSVVKSAAAGTVSNNTVNTSGKLAFAVKFGEDMQSGHYTTNVKLALVMEPAEVASIEYKLIYDANDVYVNNSPESALVTVPSAQTYTDTSASTSYTFTVSSSTPSDGWKGGCGQSFKGWSTSKNGSIEYSPGSQITLQSNSPITTLYAIWRQRICVG